jgi:hypothetical protein
VLWNKADRYIRYPGVVIERGPDRGWGFQVVLCRDHHVIQGVHVNPHRRIFAKRALRTKATLCDYDLALAVARHLVKKVRNAQRKLARPRPRRGHVAIAPGIAALSRLRERWPFNQQVVLGKIHGWCRTERQRAAFLDRFDTWVAEYCEHLVRLETHVKRLTTLVLASRGTARPRALSRQEAGGGASTALSAKDEAWLRRQLEGLGKGGA